MPTKLVQPLIRSKTSTTQWGTTALAEAHKLGKMSKADDAPRSSAVAMDRTRRATATGSGMGPRSNSEIAELDELAQNDPGGKVQCQSHRQLSPFIAITQSPRDQENCCSLSACDMEMSWMNRHGNGTDHHPHFRRTRRTMLFLDNLIASRKAVPNAMDNLLCQFLGRTFMPDFCKTISTRSISIIELPSRSSNPGIALTWCPAAMAHRAVQFGPMGSFVAKRARVISV